jgi:hypothetical protein
MYQYLVTEHPLMKELMKEFLQKAVEGSLTKSWQQTRIVLLFKKGDPQLLKSWRPLSLVNRDAKLFTKLITYRIKYLTNVLINPYQTGFSPKRLISDNGWISHKVMAHLRNIAPQEPMVAVLLYQEKAYDRVQNT